MMENKRSPCSVDQGSITTLASKRHKADLCISAKERTENIGERIVALQQLISPFGKTDTASVLHDAMDYIKFLHEQVAVLSIPYLRSTPTLKVHEVEHHSLRSRGLCLIPVSHTFPEADICTPIMTTSPKFEKVITQFFDTSRQHIN